jgi:hypothetical protein
MAGNVTWEQMWTMARANVHNKNWKQSDLDDIGKQLDLPNWLPTLTPEDRWEVMKYAPDDLKKAFRNLLPQTKKRRY